MPSTIIAEGKKIADDGIRYTVDLAIGCRVTACSACWWRMRRWEKRRSWQALAAAGRRRVLPFLGTGPTGADPPVLVIAAEDPPEYTAYSRRPHPSLLIRRGLTFYFAPRSC